MKTFLIDFLIRIITLDYLVFKQVVNNFIKECFLGRRRVDVLDLGCGTGRLAGLFSKRGYLGIDIDPKAINLAKKINRDYRFEVGDATELRLNRKFDAIIVIGVVHHLSGNDFGKMMKTISLCLKREGKALFIEAIPPIYQWNLLGRFLRSLDQGEYIRSLKGYKTIIAKSLKVVESQQKFGGLVDYGIVVAQR